MPHLFESKEFPCQSENKPMEYREEYSYKAFKSTSPPHNSSSKVTKHLNRNKLSENVKLADGRITYMLWQSTCKTLPWGLWTCYDKNRSNPSTLAWSFKVTGGKVNWRQSSREGTKATAGGFAKRIWGCLCIESWWNAQARLDVGLAHT